jgi:hypothetical protein
LPGFLSGDEASDYEGLKAFKAATSPVDFLLAVVD